MTPGYTVADFTREAAAVEARARYAVRGDVTVRMLRSAALLRAQVDQQAQEIQRLTAIQEGARIVLLDQVLAIVVRHTIVGHSVVTPVLGAIIREIAAMRDPP